MEVKPITPKEVKESRLNNIPDEVILAVNRALMSESVSGEVQITVMQSDLIEGIQAQFALAGREISKEEIFKNKYLNFEDIYKNAGWKISYDEPAYNENYYKPRFIFCKR